MLGGYGAFRIRNKKNCVCVTVSQSSFRARRLHLTGSAVFLARDELSPRHERDRGFKGHQVLHRTTVANGFGVCLGSFLLKLAKGRTRKQEWSYGNQCQQS